MDELSLFCFFVLIILARRMFHHRNMMFYRAAMRRRMRAFAIRKTRLQINPGRRRRPIIWAYPRPQRWVEEMLANRFLDRLWKRNFRVTKETFEFICRLVAQDIRKQNTRFRDAVPIPKRVAVALWRLGSGNTFRTISTTFGIGKATAIKICHEFCTVMNRMKRDFISLPSDEYDVKESIRKFAENFNFPQAIGVIDGTHIEIKEPTTNGADYFNRKQVYSIVTQAVVDYRMLFMDVSTGWPGSIHDARILRLSTFFTEMENGNVLSDPVKVINGCNVKPQILGDPAYPLRPWLMTPYPSRTVTTVVQQRLNTRLSKARVTVERAFGLLKCRWRCLLKQLEESTQQVPQTILTCCILHNLCIYLDDEFDVDDESDDDDDEGDDDDDVSGGYRGGDGGGRRIRLAITDYL